MKRTTALDATPALPLAGNWENKLNLGGKIVYSYSLSNFL